MRTRCTVILGILGLTGAHTALAGAVTVPGDFETIQAALDDPSTGDGDEIVLVAAEYSGVGNCNLDFNGQAITLRSASGDPATCTILCSGDGRGFFFHRGETAATRVEGIEVAGGSAGTGGGMLMANGSTPTIVRCRFRQNAASGDGGGVACIGSAPRFEECTFTGNFADVAGGGLSLVGSDAVFVDCLFTGNSTAAIGGGASIANSVPLFDGCRFEDNQASTGGGAVHAVDSVFAATGCRFTGNEAPAGGGIFLSSSSPRIIDCVLSGNEAGKGGGLRALASDPLIVGTRFESNTADLFSGGAISTRASSPVIANCLFRLNTAPNGGGALHHEVVSLPRIVNCTFTDNDGGRGGGAAFASASAVTIENSILWNNTPSEVLDPDAMLLIRHSNVEGGWSGAGKSNLDADPAFVDADSGDLRLTVGSPMIDAGDDAALPADTADLDGDGDEREPLPIDFDGSARIVGEAVDLGVYERQPSRPCGADLDGDGSIGFTDLLAILAAWGPCPVDCPEDLDATGDVGFTDLLRLLADWGDCPG
ncbi:MAG: right-handed parallel beta-helix repeat-containing protein [Phycisphaerae bacterium]|nr:right-handed parallel beta-helix repeat-containing protein [Phycisphaerae bacterium]NNF44971.1 right-handed parallel beta-helix repeat-containing protein [Phycisphaerales bacterium]